MAPGAQRAELGQEPPTPDGPYLSSGLATGLSVPIDIQPVNDQDGGMISVAPYPTEVYGTLADYTRSLGAIVFNEEGHAILEDHPDRFPVVAEFTRDPRHPWFSSIEANRVNGRKEVNAMHTKTRLANGAVACRERFKIKNVGVNPGELDGKSPAEKRERREAYWELVRSFDGLSKDQYVDPNNPIERWRAHSHLLLDFDSYGNQMTLRLLPHGPFTARHATNQYLNEEHPEREFDPLPHSVLKNPILHETIAGVVDRLPPYIADALKNGTMGASVLVNQFDVRTKEDGEEAFITPEGKKLSEYEGFDQLEGTQAGNTRMHIDGQDMIVVMLVREENVENDYVFVASTDKPQKADKFRLDRAGDLYMLDESMPAEDGSRQQKTMHGVAPMRSKKPGQVASRKVLIFNFNFYNIAERAELLESYKDEDLVSTDVRMKSHARDFHAPAAWTELPDSARNVPFATDLSLDATQTGSEWLHVA